MWNLPVTIPAKPSFPLLDIRKRTVQKRYVFIHIFMTANAVFQNNRFAGILYQNYLRLHPKGKHRSMSDSIFCFEIVFSDNIVVWHMTVIAICPFPMGALLPCDILWCHDMTVYAGIGVIRKIGMRVRYIKYKKNKTQKNGDQNE